MNRRSFFNILNRLVVSATIVLPLTIHSYCPVKQEIIKPKIDNSYLVGYRGSQFIQTGWIYAPYIPLYQTNEMVDDELSNKDK